MSRSNSRRPTTHSRGSSSQGHRSLSVTEALQNIRFTEPVSEHPVGLSSSYATLSGRRRGSHRDNIARYEHSSEPSTSYPSDTLDPSVLESSPNYSHPSYSDLPPSTTSPYSSSSGTMSYPSYTQAPLSNPYPRHMGSSRSSNYGKSAALIASDSHSCRPLNEAGYPNPRTEASMSRSMSGPSLPSVSPSAYEEVRSVGRDFVERRRHNVHRPRRQRKIIMRQAVLPSTMRASKAEDMSGSIDSFLAHSSSSYDCPSPYLGTSSHTPYGSSRYDTSLTPTYTSGNNSTPFASSSQGYPPLTSTAPFDYGRPRPTPRHGTENPVVLEGPPPKPQCWDHGCNGRQFSTFSNLLRHQREKSGSSAKSICHRCGAEFTRKTARDGHLAHDKCKQKSPAR